MDNNIVITTKNELTALIEKAVENAITKITSESVPARQEPDKFIRGIKGLAAFLHVSIPTAQKLKNNRVFPCYQDGRICVFKEREVLTAMSNYMNV